MKRKTLNYGTLEYWKQEVEIYTYEKKVLLNALENVLKKEHSELIEQIIQDINSVNSMLEWSEKNLNKQISNSEVGYAD